MFNFDISNKQLFAQNSVLANEIMTVFEKKNFIAGDRKPANFNQL